MSGRPTALDESLRAFAAHGLAADPVLANLAERGMLFEAQTVIAEAGRALAAEHWTVRAAAEAFADLPLPYNAGEAAALGVLMCTGAAAATERSGLPMVTRIDAEEAVRRVRACVATLGFASVVRVYLAVTALQDLVALRYYEHMPEDRFVSGEWHRPWSFRPLADELLAGLAAGLLRLRVEGGQRQVILTDIGRGELARLEYLLDATGFAGAQRGLLTVSGFNAVKLEEIFAREGVALGALRQDFVGFASLEPGWTVLECGAGAGDNIFDGGLLDAVEPGGRVIETDPAVGPLQRLRERVTRAALTNVETVVARAESLPQTSDSVDAVVGSFFLQFTDLGRAVTQALRVCRPGGALCFAVFTATAEPLPGWLRDWFAPLFQLAERFGVSPTLRLHDAGEVPRALLAAGAVDVRAEPRESRWVVRSPEDGVAHAIRGVNFFGAVLERLPWRAREALVHDLVERGRAICEHLPEGERTVLQPVEFVRARKAGAGGAPTPGRLRA